jgi:hypothetical protein
MSTKGGGPPPDDGTGAPEKESFTSRAGWKRHLCVAHVMLTGARDAVL